MNVILSFVLTITAFLADAQQKDSVRGRFTEKIHSYETVVPRKVTETGSFLTHRLPHFYGDDFGKRGRRSRDNQMVHYMVPLDGSDHLVSLWPSDEFMSPSMIVEHHETGKPDGIRLTRQRPARCLYSGIVRGVEGSKAALSTCSGLAGFIKTPSDYYYIEPVEDEGTASISDHHPHLVYKPLTWDNLSQTNCGTENRRDEALRDRLRWEAEHGLETEARITGKETSPSDLLEQCSAQGKRGVRSCDICKPYCVTPCPPKDSLCLSERPMYLELMVAIDHKTAGDLPTNDVDEFIDVIINMVVMNFYDASLGHTMYIKLVRKIHLGYTYGPLDVRRYSPHKILDNFCEFQMLFNPTSEEHPNHHDFAVLITKFKPCQGRILGMAYMASICRPDKSCAVVSGDGLLLANIITHQIGHSLSADHDDSSSNSCAAQEPDGTTYHMGPIITTASTEWSSCSRQCISQFLKTHASWCLTDLPSTAELSQPVLLPGQVYTAAAQCTLNFGTPSIACFVGDICQRLFCKLRADDCVSLGSPPAQGTECGPNMWCFNGKCVWRGQRPGAINGEWGPWSPWTPCTKTCGGGVQNCHRACMDPAPAHGGRYCVGDWRKSQICSVKTCPGINPSFADIQCKLTDSRHYYGIQYTWNAYSAQSLDLECVLVCINEKKHIAVRSPLVVDGTFCRVGTRDVCIHGKCNRVGCDWVVDSNAKEDACGICHGNGTECRIVHGLFGADKIEGMVPFLKLPVGASMVYLRETVPSPCYLTITNSYDSTFYLNNYRDREQIPGVFQIQDIHGVYQIKSGMERVFIKTPLKTPVTVSILCHEGQSFKGVHFQYAIPERNNQYIPVYRWIFLTWETCSFPCGGGSQKARPVCVEERGGEVEDAYCVKEKRPSEMSRNCNARPCPSQWWVGPWAVCDCYLGEGVTSRIVLCVRVKDIHHMHVTIVKPKECLSIKKPRLEKQCNPAKDTERLLNQICRETRDAYDIIPYNDDADEYDSMADLGDLRFFNKSVNVRELAEKENDATTVNCARSRRRLRPAPLNIPDEPGVVFHSVKKTPEKDVQPETPHPNIPVNTNKYATGHRKDKTCKESTKMPTSTIFYDKMMEPEYLVQSCAPRESAAAAEEKLESHVEIQNVSNIEIMNVEIETTDRLNRQQDEEFILLNNMDIYPVGNPENVKVVVGDSAAKLLKQIKQQATPHPIPDINEGKSK